MKKLIAHRGNISGPNIDENKPEYLIKTMNKGFFVELDLWFVNNILYLGHDKPQYIIKYSFLLDNKDKIFIHCKNIEALHYCLEKNDNLEFFFHDSDDCVLTSKGNIWTFPGKKLTDKSICVMPEKIKSDYNLNICHGICTDYVLKYKSKVAILLSGHIRNFQEIINEFKENLIKPIEQYYDYDINIHTWDTNIVEIDYLKRNKYFTKLDINKEYIYNLFKKNNLNINKIIIENQKEVANKLDLKTFFEKQLQGKKVDRNVINALFFQYYGHYKVLNCLDLNNNYEFIIKTRPDMFYEKFDMDLFKYNIFFPFSHQKRGIGSNINQLFFGGKTEYMLNILKYFENIIYNNKNFNFTFIDKYDNSNFNLNCLFRTYIYKYLNYKPFFTRYNPKIYRHKDYIISFT